MPKAAAASACRSCRTARWSTAKGSCSMRRTTERPPVRAAPRAPSHRLHQTNAHTGRCRAPVLPCTTSRASMRARIFCRWRMTLYTLGPNENKDGPFAEVHARNEFEARRRVQSVDTRRNWHDLNAVYCVPVGSTDTRYVAVGEVRIFERFEDLPPA